MKVSILGCGWFGTALAKSLTGKGIEVKGSTTSPEKLGGSRTHLVNLRSESDSTFDQDFFDCDLLIVANNVGMNDEALFLCRTNYTLTLIREFNIEKVIFISSTSVYGEPNTIVNENTPPQPETLSANLLWKAEQLFQSRSFSCTILRFGGLVGPGRDPGKFFAGKVNIHNGLAAVNLLHLVDAVGITEYYLAAEYGNIIINAVSPNHPTKMEFYTESAKRSGLPSPEFIAERTHWKIVNSIYAGYNYTGGLML